MSTPRITGEHVHVDGLRRPVPRALVRFYLDRCNCGAPLRHGPGDDEGTTEIRCMRDHGRPCGRRFVLDEDGRIRGLDADAGSRFFAAYFGARAS